MRYCPHLLLPHHMNMKVVMFTQLPFFLLFNAELSHASNGCALNNKEESLGEAKSQLGKEEEELEKAISGITAQVDRSRTESVVFI